jgi:uncharacterized membrane protein HdeD (DUF308 family)
MEKHIQISCEIAECGYVRKDTQNESVKLLLWLAFYCVSLKLNFKSHRAENQCGGGFDLYDRSVCRVQKASFLKCSDAAADCLLALPRSSNQHMGFSISPNLSNFIMGGLCRPRSPAAIQKEEIFMTALPFLESVRKNWWLWIIRGVLAILFGLLAFAIPGITLVSLALVYGVYAFADGLTSLWVGASSRVWSLVLIGILGIAVGIYTFFFPGITAFALLYLIAAWAIVRGIFEIISAIRLRKEITNEWWLVLSGAISIIFGAALFVNPGAGAVAMVWVIGIYAIVFGIMMIVLAFRLHGLRRGGGETSPQT